MISFASRGPAFPNGVTCVCATLNLLTQHAVVLDLNIRTLLFFFWFLFNHWWLWFRDFVAGILDTSFLLAKTILSWG